MSVSTFQFRPVSATVPMLREAFGAEYEAVYQRLRFMRWLYLVGKIAG